MGFCNTHTSLLLICIIQLIAMTERIIVDFLGYLYASLIPNFVQVIIVIVAIFGLCLYNQKLLIAYLAWSIIFIGWNIFVICVYLQVGSFNESDAKILSFGIRSSKWIELTQTCSENGTCTFNGHHIETLHAAIQITTSLIGAVLSSYIIYAQREKDDPGPVFQVYKTPTSRRGSNASLNRLDRPTTNQNNAQRLDGSLSRSNPWLTPTNDNTTSVDTVKRASTRSRRSNHSLIPNNDPNNSLVRSNQHQQHGNSSRSSNRSQKRRSSRGRSRSNSGKQSDEQPPWTPKVAVRDKIPSSNRANNGNVNPPGRSGHENPSYAGYASSSDNPYTDYSHSHNNGLSPFSLPQRNLSGRPNGGMLHMAASTVTDLPPPLDEGPEAYSRDSVAFPAPPPPLSDGPEPYRGEVSPSSSQQPPFRLQSRHTGRPNHIPIGRITNEENPAHSERTLSTPSSPGSVSAVTDKSDQLSGVTSISTPEKLPLPALPPSHSPTPQSPSPLPPPHTHPALPQPHRPPSHAHPFSVPPQRQYPPYAEINVPMVPISSRSRSPASPKRPTINNPVGFNAHQTYSTPYNRNLDYSNSNTYTTSPTTTAITSSSNSVAMGNSQTPQVQRAYMSRAGADKENTFKRMVNGELAISKPNQNPPISVVQPQQDHQYAKNSTYASLVTTTTTTTTMAAASVSSQTITASHMSSPNITTNGQMIESKTSAPSNIPPWKRNNVQRNNNQQPREPSHQNPSSVLAPRMALRNERPPPVSQVSEVTSSYGGLYSSKLVSPGPRRALNLTTPANPYPYNNRINQLRNATDDAKTRHDGAFVSSTSLVI